MKQKLRWWKTMKPLLGGLLVCCSSSMARAELDTIAVYGNGDGPSIDGTTTAGFTNNGGGSYSLTAGGSDFWGNSDNGVFLYDSTTMTSGDFTAVVRAASYGGPDPLAGEWGRTGPMARASAADANSANVMTTQKSGGGVALTQQGRRSNGGGTERDGGEWADTGSLSAASGQPIWLALTRTSLPQGDFFISHYATDNGGVPGDWSEPRFRPVTADLAGDLSVGLAHQSHSIPRVNTANFDNWSLGPVDESLPPVVFPKFLDSVPDDLPSPGNGVFGILEVTNNGGIGDQNAALNSIANGGGVRVAYQRNGLNYNENGGEGVIPGGTPFETDVQGLLAGDSVGPDANDRTNNISIMAHAKIEVTQGGTYSFRTDSDDGFRVMIPGKSFSNVSNGGLGYFDEGTAMEFFGGRGTAATTGDVDLDPGVYDLYWTYHEGGGGAAGELTYSYGGASTYLLVGDPNGADAIAPGNRPVALTGPASVVNGAFATDIAATRAEILNNAVNNPQAPTLDTDIVVLKDGAISGRPGTRVEDQAVTFPNGGGDNYTTGVFGSLVVDDGDEVAGEEIELTFGVFSDDNAQFRIINGSFTGTAGDGNTTLVDVDGDMALTGDFRTGNTNSLGHITLTEGTYEFEGFHLEEGGGSGYEVWFAEGTWNAYDALNFYPLSTSTELWEGDPAVPGLTLVPEPSSITLVLCGFGGLMGMMRRRRSC